MIGQTVANYRIIDFLGDGVSGSVYSAEDLKRHRLAALKILTPELARNEIYVRKLQSDLEKVSTIHHPGLPRIYEQGLSDGMRFVAMQLLDGDTLEAHLRKETISLMLGVELAAETAEALREAHARGLVHRDLKPANLVITAQGLKVLGLGQTPTDHGAQETGANRDYYLSPEQVRGHPAGTTSDIYSLGVILYEMVTRRRPFSGENPAAIRQAILTAPLEPPSAHVSNLPQSLDRVIVKALERDPSKRHVSMDEFLSEVREAGRDINAQVLARAPLVRRRRRHFGTLLPTMATILVLVIIWLMWRALKGELR
jgi:eukaryotic-like serine/threonine-protein kinase